MIIKLKKKLAGGLKKLSFLIIFLLILIKNTSASQIIDFETEKFINTLIEDIKSINNINRKIEFRIIANNNINAYVDENNIIYITSSLIEYCEDYVALLSVISHELGHIVENHILQRKKSFKKIDQLNNISKLSIIAGSMITKSPQVLSSIAITSAGGSNYYLNFSKNQEREADLYSVKTLSNLGLHSNSITNLLKTIEKKTFGIDEESQKRSTHPSFSERIELQNFLNINKKNIFDKNLNNEFKYIKSKFIGYNQNKELINIQEEPFRTYSRSIMEAQNGNLIESMKNINKLILEDSSNNIFLIETKADILFSYGYTKEAVNFYKKVIRKEPQNKYAQIRIFENFEILGYSESDYEILFIDNMSLLQKYYNNKNILLAYYKLSEIIKKDEWVKFLNYWINNKSTDTENIINELDKFKKTNDKNLLILVNLIYKTYK
tara:strand:- start:2172 stop:3482 length:1311 start_codon:yes stop_codon:yes gene_type:complete